MMLCTKQKLIYEMTSKKKNGQHTYRK